MPLSPASAKADRPVDLVIPDCCNIGVVFRSLLAANVAVLTACIAQSGNWKSGMSQFVETSMLIEMACLWSLLALCLLRRTLLRAPERMAAWAQRASCAIVPAVVTGFIVHLFGTVEWLADAFNEMAALKGMLVAALFGALLQHYFELRTRAFSPALVEARLQALQARIRPHFFFNSLNAVLSLIRTEPRRAEDTLEDLADLFRVLMSDPRHMTSLESELRLCAQYLSIEKIRLGERLQVQWDAAHVTEDVLRKAQVPVLLLQPLLENAVHYGVEPASEPTLVQVHVGRSLDRIEVVVVNPYRGQAPVAGNQIALANIRERLALLYDVEAQLTTTVARGFFEVRVRFPYTKGAA